MGKNKRLDGSVLFFQFDDIIEQQTKFIDNEPVEPIRHNTRRHERAWDVDDNWRYYATGTMNEGDSYSVSLPFVADGQGHLIGMQGGAGRRQRFTLKLSIPEIGFTHEIECKKNGKFCLVGPWMNLFTDPRVTQIVDSNGGRGVEATAIFEVKAITKLQRAGFFYDFRYPCHQLLDGICGGHKYEILTWDPMWWLIVG